jgi:hypothetical protein
MENPRSIEGDGSSDPQPFLMNFTISVTLLERGLVEKGEGAGYSTPRKPVGE